MSRGINKVILIGHLGQDPQTRAMPSGKAVANLRIATSEQWRDKQTGEKREATEWHSVIFFERMAEVCAEYLRKGSQVYIEGRLRTRKWEKDGQDHYSTEIVGSTMQMLGSPQNVNQQPARPATRSGDTAGGGSAPAQDDFDDDIPF